MFSCLFAALLGVSLVTMASFYVASPAAGFLMLPYLGWTCFATTLINCSLWDNNPAVVKSAHKFAQVKPQDTPDMSRANSGAYIRNKAAPADLGRGDFNEMSSEAGSEIHYSNRPILGEGQVHAETGGWNKQPEANHAWGQQQQQPQQQPYQQQQGWQQSQPWSQTAAAQAQPVTTTPFAESGLHRRSATDTDRDRRVTRRTTDEELDRFATHTDSGHLIMPPQFEKPEQKGNSGLFAKVSHGSHVCICLGCVCYQCRCQTANFWADWLAWAQALLAGGVGTVMSSCMASDLAQFAALVRLQSSASARNWYCTSVTNSHTLNLTTSQH